MKISNGMKDSQTFLTKLNWKIGGRVFGFGISPEADWKIIFVSTTILAVLAVVLSVFMFRKIDKGDIFVTEQSVGPEEQILDATLLRETVLYYQNKARELEKIKRSVTPVADPGL